MEKFKNSFLWTLFGQLAIVTSQFVIMMLISKVGGIEHIGLYGVITAFVSPIQMFFYLDVGKLLISDRDNLIPIEAYHTFILWTSLAIICFSIIVISIIYRDLSIILLGLSFTFYRAFTNYKEFLFSMFQKIGKVAWMGKLMAIQAFFESVTFLLCFIATRNMVFSFFMLALVNCTVYLLFERRLFLKVSNMYAFGFDWDFQYQKKLFHKSFPLGLSLFLNSFKLNIPRYFLEFMMKDRASLGLFTVFSQCVLAIGYINTAAGKSSLSHLSTLFYDDFIKFKKFLVRICLSSMLSVFIVIIAVFFVGDFLIKVFFGEHFLSGIFILYGLLITRVFIFPTTYLKTAQILLKQYSEQLSITIVSSVVVIVISFITYKSFNVHGLLLALFLGEGVVFLYSVYLVRKGLKRFKE